MNSLICVVDGVRATRSGIMKQLVAPRIALTRDGQLIGLGRPEDVLNAPVLRHAYGVDVRILAGPDGLPSYCRCRPPLFAESSSLALSA